MVKILLKVALMKGPTRGACKRCFVKKQNAGGKLQFGEEKTRRTQKRVVCNIKKTAMCNTARERNWGPALGVEACVRPRTWDLGARGWIWVREQMK